MAIGCVDLKKQRREAASRKNARRLQRQRQRLESERRGASLAAWTLRVEFGLGVALLGRIGGYLGAELAGVARPDADGRLFAALAMEMASRFGKGAEARKERAREFALGKAASDDTAGVRKGSVLPAPEREPDPGGMPRAFLNLCGREGDERSDALLRAIAKTEDGLSNLRDRSGAVTASRHSRRRVKEFILGEEPPGSERRGERSAHTEQMKRPTSKSEEQRGGTGPFDCSIRVLAAAETGEDTAGACERSVGAATGARNALTMCYPPPSVLSPPESDPDPWGMPRAFLNRHVLEGEEQCNALLMAIDKTEEGLSKLHDRSGAGAASRHSRRRLKVFLLGEGQSGSEWGAEESSCTGNMERFSSKSVDRRGGICKSRWEAWENFLVGGPFDGSIRVLAAAAMMCFELNTVRDVTQAAMAVGDSWAGISTHDQVAARKKKRYSL